ncbi:hypothetical protein H9L19_02240 [Weissella diestrammenae]|uniref:Uncharacterized protein n=1 Tax=Weissella diestrammenae TaxID=1162633 RepID=A0A7G9T6I5_9LACO|nr:hypothetical protein [Weissella diestrammenae]MCM0583235.1 hypothetical protein [Weissella diestrammenae]QNN75710.1 hypothetical protein H9L19_02240 [Weissella diestrammenae]
MNLNATAGILATILSFLTFAFFVPNLITGAAKTSAYAWTFSLVTAASQLILMAMSHENFAGLLRPLALCFCISIVVFVAYRKETNSPTRLDYICGTIVLIGMLFAFFGQLLLKRIGIQTSALFAADISLSLLTALAILPNIATILGIKKGNHEIPQIIAIDAVASLMGLFALNIWNVFTVFGPLLIIILDLRTILYAIYYNAQREKNTLAFKEKRDV